MKTFIVATLLALLTAPVMGQTDSVSVRLQRLEQQQADINMRLEQYQHDYTVGYTIFIVGASVTCLGILAQSVSDNPDKVGYSATMVVGGFIGFAGLVKIGDATKNLKRSTISVSPGSVSLKF